MRGVKAGASRDRTLASPKRAFREVLPQARRAFREVPHVGSKTTVRPAFRPIALATLLVLVGGALAALAISDAVAHGTRSTPPVARVGRVVSVSEKVELHLVRAVGESLVEEGKATGTLPGTAKITLNIDAARGTATARFSFYLHGGTLSGRSSGTAHGGHGGWESFSGKVRLEHGSGRYAHASGSGTIYGALYRRTDRLIVQESGRLRY